MTILRVEELAISGVKLVFYRRYRDDRGYFSEIFRPTDLDRIGILGPWAQCNESFSEAGVTRGFHFQESPPQGKLIRPIFGAFLDLILDIRSDSLTFGRALIVPMLAPAPHEDGLLLWIPAGLAHGLAFKESACLEYFCTAEYASDTEVTVSIVDPSIDWSLNDRSIKSELSGILAAPVQSARDKNAQSFENWRKCRGL